MSPACDIPALPWGPACEPWPHPGAGVELPGLCVLQEKLLYMFAVDKVTATCVWSHTHLAGPCCRKGNHRIKATKTTCFSENLADAGRAEPPLMLSAISSLPYPSSGEFTCSLFFILETEMSVPPPVLPGFREMGKPTLALWYKAL